MQKLIVVLVVLAFSSASLFSQGYWSKRFGQSGTNNNVPQALNVDNAGNVFIGGGFDYVYGVKTNYFARWNPSTGWDSLPGVFTGSSFPISSIAAGAGSDIYVAGSFSGVGTLTKRGIVKWTGTQWDSVPGTYAMQDFANTMRIVFANGVLYAIGTFTKVGSMTNIHGVARFNGTQWDSMGSLRYTNSNNSVNNTAFTVTDDGRIYAATYAVDTWNQENVAIVKWNGTAWDTVAKGLTGSAGGINGSMSKAHVNDIAVHGDTIYVVGAFSNAGTKIANCIAKWNGTAWDSLGEGTNTELTNVEIDSLGRVYVGGARSPFTVNNGTEALARWDGNKWERLGMGISKSQYGQSPVVRDMKIVGSMLYLAGDFREPGGIGATGAVAYDIAADQWKPLSGKNANGFSSAVYAYHETKNGEIFVGGEFNFAGAVNARRLARWNVHSWDTVGTGNYKNNSVVKAISSDDSVVYIGGEFSTFNGVSSTGVIKWNGHYFVSMNGAGQPGFDVRVITRYGNDLIIGGNFQSFFGTFPNGKAVNAIVKWNGSKYDSLDVGIKAGTSNGQINAMAVNNADLYVAGNFTSAGNVSASSVAKWNGTSWSALNGDIIRYSKSAAAATVTAMAVVGNDLYIAGKFDSIGTKPMWHLAKWNGSQWDSVSLGLKGDYSGIADMAVDNAGRLYVVGKFTSINGDNTLRYVARWDGSKWDNLGALTSNFQQDMFFAESDSKGNIYISGYFGYVNGFSSQNFAAWINDPGIIESVRRIPHTSAPGRFILNQNYPNPFNPSTTVRFTLPSDGLTTLTVYDIVGREVAVIVNESLTAGTYEKSFDGSRLSSGLYFYRLKAGNRFETKKMLLVK
ncbi:MAG: T9SS type A sorting domain-containing protein [Bacteroidota bacterium]